MPAYRGYKKKRGRRSRRKRSRYRRKRKGVLAIRGSWNTFLLGPQIRVKHRYFLRVTIDPGAGLASQNVLMTNGMFDPNVTGGGHQPRGFDQLGLLFNTYYVEKSFIKCQFINNSVAATSTYVVIIAKDTSNLTSTSLEEWMENRVNVNTVMGPETGSKQLSMWDYPARSLGYPMGRAEDDLKGSSTSNPALQNFFHVIVAPPASADPGAMDVIIEITFYAIWSHPIEPAESA